jgi:hypothetical protein
MACAKCGSEDSIDGVRILDRGPYGEENDLSAIADENPGALLFKGRVATPITSRICGSCGYIELYAVDPGALLEFAKRFGRPK